MAIPVDAFLQGYLSLPAQILSEPFVAGKGVHQLLSWLPGGTTG